MAMAMAMANTTISSPSPSSSLSSCTKPALPFFSFPPLSLSTTKTFSLHFHTSLPNQTPPSLPNRRTIPLLATTQKAAEAEAEEEEEEEDDDEDEEALEEEEVLEEEPLEDMFLPPGFGPADVASLRRLPSSNIFLGPAGRDGRVKQAEFVKSSTKAEDCPKNHLPEFALVGRSNVGKSSLVNTLVKRKDLAKTSKKPGKTQTINHFIINNSWYLVDLPGYGFANVPHQIRTNWNVFTKDYFRSSESLVCVLLLIDASIPPQQVDLEFADWLATNKIPVTIVFTKCDRRKKKKNGGKKPSENVKEFKQLLKKSFGKVPPWIMTSSVTNQGKRELLIHIAQLRNTRLAAAHV